jgi:threonine/homoserine/homoserine lactone efflux protein
MALVAPHGREERKMTLAGMLLFCGVYSVAVASPGPGIAALVARVLGRGLRGVPAFIAGYVAGDLVWFTLAATGLTLLAQTFAVLFTIIKYAGAAYLLYLAWRLWTPPAAAADRGPAPRSDGTLRLFLGGLSITLGNPKFMVFFLALLPTVVDLARLDRSGFLSIAALIVVLLSAILGAYALAAASARRLFASPRALRTVNRGTGVVMAGAAVVIVAR